MIGLWSICFDALSIGLVSLVKASLASGMAIGSLYVADQGLGQCFGCRGIVNGAAVLCLSWSCGLPTACHFKEGISVLLLVPQMAFLNCVYVW